MQGLSSSAAAALKELLDWQIPDLADTVFSLRDGAVYWIGSYPNPQPVYVNAEADAIEELRAKGFVSTHATFNERPGEWHFHVSARGMALASM